MAWTATLLEKRLHRGQLDVVVRFTDGRQTFEESFSTRDDPGSGWLAQAIRIRTAALDRLTAFSGTLAPGPIDLTVLPPPPPPEPDPAEIARAAWLADHRQWLRYQEAVKLGVLPADAPEITTLAAVLRANWLPEYVDSLRG